MSITSDDVDVDHPLHKISDFKSIAKVTVTQYTFGPDFLTLIKRVPWTWLTSSPR